MCLYPKLIANPKYRANKKNGGIIPAVFDNRILQVPIGCGNCIECRKKKKREWQIRLYEECEENKNGIFVTLTFSNESIRELGKEIKNLDGYERDNAIATLAVRRFLERWRKKHKKSVRHWLITELGHNGTENIHLHGIIWTDNRKDIGNMEIQESNAVATIAVRRFLERWRKKYKKSVKHFLITELGHNGTERIHLHGNLS